MMNWFLGDGEWRPIRQGAGEVRTGMEEKDGRAMKVKL
jgi:hypothetical protein